MKTTPYREKILVPHEVKYYITAFNDKDISISGFICYCALALVLAALSIGLFIIGNVIQAYSIIWFLIMMLLGLFVTMPKLSMKKEKTKVLME